MNCKQEAMDRAGETGEVVINRRVGQGLGLTTAQIVDMGRRCGLKGVADQLVDFANLIREARPLSPEEVKPAPAATSAPLALQVTPQQAAAAGIECGDTACEGCMSGDAACTYAENAAAGNAALEGRAVSVDVSTSEEDAGNRIFAHLTGETGSDGSTLLAVEIGRNFAGNATPPDAEFKNFHRLLCERFGYTHDERNWKRDQLSLIEWIASNAVAPAYDHRSSTTGEQDGRK